MHPNNRRKAALFCLLFVFCLFLVPQVSALSTQHSSNIPGLKREDLKHDLSGFLSKFSDRIGIDLPTLDELQKKKNDLHNGNLNDDVETWRSAGNVASAYNFKLSPHLTLPIDLNVIFVGFDGSGNQGLVVEEKVIRPWFENLERYIAHTTVPWALIDEKIVDAPPVEHSGISYKYNFHCIEVDESVLEVLESVLKASMRMEDPWGPAEKRVVYQVDPHSISRVLASLLSSLGLSHQYTLFFLNPKRLTPGGEVYGYRSGLSNAELGQIHQNIELLKSLQSELPVADFKLPKKSAQGEVEEFAEADDEKMGTTTAAGNKIRFSEKRKESSEWAEAVKESIDNHKSQFVDGELSITGDARFLHLVHKMVTAGDYQLKDYVRRTMTEEAVTENCLVDNWVDAKRFVFIDLSAGPFEWGPTVGGEGVKSRHTMPEVPSAERLKPKSSLSVSLGIPEQGWTKEHVQAVVTKANEEKEFLETLQVEHCSEAAATEDNAELAELCSDLDSKLNELMHLLTELEERPDEIDQSVIDHAISLLGSEHEGNAALETMHGFLSKLSAIVGTAQRHVFSPSTSSLATRYSARVHYHLYIISNHNSYNPTDARNFDYAEFTYQLDHHRLQSQEFKFSVHTYSMAEDAGLAMAFETSLRSNMVPGLKADGVFSSSSRLYLDSLLLEHEIKKFYAAHYKADVLDTLDIEKDASTKIVPIFLFSLDYPVPVLIDRHYQAKALEDMVLVVQSDHPLWESHLGCNMKPITYNLRNPTRAAIASTLHHLTGTLPMHIAFNEQYNRICQDWLFATGNTPLAHTSSMVGASHLAIDNTHRGYVARELAESLASVNHVVVELSKLKTSSGNYYLHTFFSEELQQAYADVRYAWKQVIVHATMGDFDGAMTEIAEVHVAVDMLQSTAMAAKQLFFEEGCLHRADASWSSGKAHADGAWSENEGEWLFCVVLSLAAAMAVVLYVLRPRNKKPKVN